MPRSLGAAACFLLLAVNSGRAAPPSAHKGECRARVRAPVLAEHRLPPLQWGDLADPSGLSPEEEALPTVAALAKRYNPAMAFPTRDIWPVEVRYAWHDGSPLMARVISDDGRVVREFVALPHERLAGDDWGDLPTHDETGNRKI